MHHYFNGNDVLSDFKYLFLLFENIHIQDII